MKDWMGCFVAMLMAVTMAVVTVDAAMEDYCVVPSSVNQSVPPLVMLAMGRDHKIYYEAYNDASDLDGDGRLDVGYKHSIEYYGYFDPHKCYVYSGSGANARFEPVSTTSDKYCNGAWSGNFLNWLSMSRMDVIRKVFYGGYRSTDSASETVLEGAYIPQDAHSWGKEYSGADTNKLTPFSNPGSGKRHLFCVTSLSDNAPHLIRVLQNKTNRIWEWASKEHPVCDNSLGTPTDYYVRVKVCDSSKGFEANCKQYPGGGGTAKPIGLLQKYGEGDGSKVCSKTFAKSCNTDSDCNFSTEGKCIDRTQMYFGLITGSYEKNLSGGVLRKNVWSVMDEINTNSGIFQTSENVEGNIISTLGIGGKDSLRVVGFNYSTYSYGPWQWGGNPPCGWLTTRALGEGECRMWGNPMGEILYEAIRYFADKGSPTSTFIYGGTQDTGLKLPKPAWNKPYEIYPSCSKPFILIFSDINPSYDADASFSDLPGLNISTLLGTIGTSEGITGTNRFIGNNGSIYDFICSSKSIANLATIRGLCPEEPTKLGSYYSAALAYYGKTMMQSNTDHPNINTYSVVLSSPIPDINIKIGNSNVRIVPTGKSVDGCVDVKTYCNDRCTFTTDSNGLHITNCSNNAYCPTNQIVDFYVDTINYDANNNITYAKFRINFEDVEQGADHDMDAIVLYEIQPVGTNQLKVTLTSEYASGCIGQVMGFIISGTTEDGLYLPVKDKDGTFNGNANNLPLTWSKTFTIGASAASYIKDPLWYAAKWGAFTDINGNNIPDLQQEWDKDGNGVPDTYFYVTNPAKLEEELEKAFRDILKRATSGTAVSMLSSSEGSGATIAQALFYPKRSFGNTEISWVSDLMLYWYYLDPFFKYSQIREDTVREGSNSYTLLDLRNDYITSFAFDSGQNKTLAKRWQDTDGNGSPDTYLGAVPIEDAKAIWRGGFNLWWTDPASRFLKTSTGSGLISFSTSTASTLQPYLGVADTSTAKKVINYTRGYDCVNANGDSCTCGTSGCVEVGRNRTVTTGVCSSRRSPCNSVADCPSGESCVQETHVWKMGDVISATPRIMGPTPLNNYNISAPIGYNDQTYYDFITSNDYKNRQSVFVGANDGMLHSFKLGKLLQDWSGKEWYQPGRLEGGTGTGGIGFERWAFIPKNVLPYLKYTFDEDYCHLYMVDGPITIFDASINKSSTCTQGDYNDCPLITTTSDGNLDLSKTSWRTVLIGSMGIGGATSSSVATDRVPTPISVDGSPVGWSSYFALNVTDQDNPQLLWEFTDPNLGMTNIGPAVVKVGKSKRCSISDNIVCSTDSDCGETGGKCVTTNGKWYVVLASGPTGPITGQEFKGRSNQNLRLFILDLKTGALVRTIDTGIANAFAGSISSSTLDLEKNNTGDNGNYQDDVVYIGYVQNTTSGGVLRLVIDDDASPANWTVSKVIENIGPVTTSVVNLLDRKNGKLWLYFGEGRYFYKQDDLPTQRRIYGVQEPCFTGSPGNVAQGCSSSLTIGALKDQSSNPGALTSEKGWYINLDPATSTTGAERIISNPTPDPHGAVYFISLAPTSDICSFGGSTYLWAVDYKTGGQVSYAMQGKALIQVSTGEIKELDLSRSSSFPGRNQRRSDAITGLPPTGQGLMVVTNPDPMRKFMHVQER